MSSWEERDKAHLWHPLTQHGLGKEHLPIVKAKGIYLYDYKGKKYIDAISSWYTCMYGHSNPCIINKVKKGLDNLDQVVFSGFTHPPAIKFSEKLAAILPDGIEKIFFSDNGSTSVDIALKMSFQYHFNRGRRPTKVVALVDGFHGDTFGAMSVSDLSVYNGPFEPFFLEVIRVQVPDTLDENSLNQFKDLMRDKDVAAFVYEPLVQGAAGMKMLNSQVLDQMIGICKQSGIIAIADEVMTGFGKTKALFASEQMKNQPDIICLSKSLTAGIAPMAVTCTNLKVYDAFLSEQIQSGFFHGHTYSANPLACNAASAAIDLLVSDEYQSHRERVSRKHSEMVEVLKKHSKIKNAWSIGMILACEINSESDRYGSLRDKLFDFYMEKGVFLRPLGSIVYVLPPFIINDQELDYIYQIILESLEII